MPQQLLDGVVPAQNDDQEDLRREILRLRRELQIAREEALQARNESESSTLAIRELKRVLDPLHRALGMVFGEIESVVGSGPVAQPSNGPPASNPKWDSWKQKLPGRPAEIIDLLLLHENMSTKQLMAAMHCGKDAVYQAAYRLGQAGLTINSNGRYSLKQL